MEFSIKVLIVIILAMIAFIVFATLIGVFGGRSISILDMLTEFFKTIIPMAGNT